MQLTIRINDERTILAHGEGYLIQHYHNMNKSVRDLW